MTRIIYKEANGVAAVIVPCLDTINPDTNEFYTAKEVADKDVPTGYKYKIVEDSEISADRSFRDAWTVDESDLTDGEGA